MAVDDLKSRSDFTDTLFGGRETEHIHGVGDKGEKLGAQGTYLEFYHIRTKRAIRFKAFLNDLSDSFNCNFNKESAYGRPDPFFVYQNTTRTLTISWSVPAYDLDEATMNLKKCSFLASMLYPVYENVGGGNTSALAGSPIIKIKFANLISSTKAGSGGSAANNGLAGAMTSFNFSPVVSEGFFVFDAKGRSNQLFPKVVQINCTFDVIHEHPLGWRDEGDLSTSNFARMGMEMFPYGIENKSTQAMRLAAEAAAAAKRTQVLEEDDYEPVKAKEKDKATAPDPTPRAHERAKTAQQKWDEAHPDYHDLDTDEEIQTRRDEHQRAERRRLEQSIDARLESQRRDRERGTRSSIPLGSGDLSGHNKINFKP